MTTSNDYVRQADGSLKRMDHLEEEKRPESHSKEKRPSQALTSKPLARFPGLVDIVTHKDKLHFLVKDGQELKLLSEVELNGQTYQPPSKEQLPWLIPTFENVKFAYEKDDHKDLFNELVRYHEDISYLPSEEYYILFAAWVFHTYLLDSFNYSPILCFSAVPERGKSRTGKGIIYASYRGIHSETLREANMFRDSQDRGATLFLDTKDLWRKAGKLNCEDILLQRFEKGAKVSRVLYPEKGAFRDTVFYDIFGATVIATNKAINHILDTRCLSISMPEANKNYPAVDPRQGLLYRDRLVAWRAHHMNKTLPEAPELVSSRLQDIISPLWQVIKITCPDRLTLFKKLILDIQRERLDEKSQTAEAKLLTIMGGLSDSVYNGVLATSRIVDDFNQSIPEKFQKSARSLGSKLRQLGFKAARTTMGDRGIEYNSEMIEILLKKYGCIPRKDVKDVKDAKSDTYKIDNLDIFDVISDHSGGRLQTGPIIEKMFPLFGIEP